MFSMANSRLRPLVWYRKWAKKEWAIAAMGSTLFVLLFAHFSDLWSNVEVNNSKVKQSTSNLSDNFDLVELTLLPNAKQRGALCLDGSAPGYHFQKGFGSGSQSWVLHIEGGGWCDSVYSCSLRKGTALGSSKYMEKLVPFSGILSSDPAQNPEFFNWNKVKIRYCDGASFAGHPESDIKKGTRLFFRGQQIWEAVMDELLSIGLSDAKQALLTGCSAGGLATLIHCDDFRKLLPEDANVKCLADAGFFLKEKDIQGNSTMRNFYHDVVQLHGVAKSLNNECANRMEPSECLFPEEIIKNIQTPIFLVQPAYDFWQIKNILVPNGSDPHRLWKLCRLSLHKCNKDQNEILQGYRSSLLKATHLLQLRKEQGMFINSCFIHCQTWISETWHSPNSPRINNKTIAESVGDWYFNRDVPKLVDCPSFTCNPTCYNMDFTNQL